MNVAVALQYFSLPSSHNEWACDSLLGLLTLQQPL